MENENKKTEESDFEGLVENKKTFQWPKVSKKVLIIIASSFLVLAAVTGYLFYNYKNNGTKIDEDILAVVAGEEIRNSDLNKFIYGITMGGTPEEPELGDFEEIPKRQFLDMFIESKILEKELKNIDMGVPETELVQAISEKFPWMEKDNILVPFVKNYQRYLIGKEIMTTRIMGSKEGYWVMARNDRYSPDFGVEPTEEQKAKIEQNKEYSEKFIKEIHQKLTGGTIKIEEAVRLENEDNSIGKKAPGALNVGLHSAKFTEQMYVDRVGLLSHSFVLERINKLKAGEFTEPIHFKTKDGLDNGWYILYLSENNLEPMGTSYDIWFEETYKNYNVTIYLKEQNE